MKPYIFIIITFLISSNLFGQTINTNLPETDGEVKAIVAKGDTIFFGGLFSRIYTKENTSNYYALINKKTGTLMPNVSRPNNKVEIIISDGNNGFFIGGSFTTVGDSLRGGIAHLDSIGNVTSKAAGFSISSGGLSDLKIKGDTLYLIGKFIKVNNLNRKYIAAINITTNSLINWNPSPNGFVYSFEVINDKVFVGGAFTTIGGKVRNNLAAINTNDTGTATNWNPNGSGVVYILKRGENQLYVGGSFSKIGGVIRNNIASISILDSGTLSNWNPSASSTVKCIDLGYTNNSIVNKIYVSGSFQNIGGWLRRYMACVDTNGIATSWNPNPNNEGKVFIQDNSVYASGYFTSIGGASKNYFAILDTITGNVNSFSLPYNDLGNSGSRVLSIAFNNTNFCLGGDFSRMGGKLCEGLAAYNSTTEKLIDNWNPKNLYTSIQALLLHGDTLFIGGGSIAAVNVNTGKSIYSNFSLSGGLNGSIKGLIIKDNIIYAYGDYTKDWGLGTTRKYLSAYYISSGGALPLNPNIVGSSVNSAQLIDNKLYIGGTFSGINGQVRNNLACIDLATGNLTAWNPNANNTVNKIEIEGNKVFVGGSFTIINGFDRSRLALLDLEGNINPTSWNPSLNGAVRSLNILDSSFYVSGLFTTSGSGGINYALIKQLTYFTGSENASWTLNNCSKTSNIVLKNNLLFVGGEFTGIDSKSRSNLVGIYVNSNFSSLILNTNYINSNFSGDTQKVNITSNQNWNITSNQSWATTSITNGSGDGNFTIYTTENLGPDRSALISVTTNSITKYVTVFQNQNSTSIQEKADNGNKINIYPNPNNGKFEIDFFENNDLKEITIYDFLGNLVLTKQTNELKCQIDLKGLSKGIYVVNINSSSKRFSSKIIIN